MSQPPQGPTDPGYGAWTPPAAPPPSQWSPPPSQWSPPPVDQQAWTPTPAPKPRPRRGLIATIVAVLALAGGGVASYVAFADSAATGGAASPKAAVQSLVTDLNNSDLLGMLDDLPPGERDALAQPVRDEIDQLKRLHVLSSSANGDAVSGVTFSATGLTYGASPTVINDHVQAVEVTGGTLDVTADASKLPFTSEFMRLAKPHGTAHQHLDIAAAERGSGRPLWIATQQVGDRWYPSLFYTVAVNATNAQVPPAAERVAAAGADSPEDAVRSLVTDLLNGDVRGALALASPDETAVLHDYAGLILRSVPSYHPSPVEVQTLDLSTTTLSGGAVRVSLDKLAVNTPNGPVSVTRDGDCFQATSGGDSRRVCADQLTRILGLFQVCVTMSSRSYSDYSNSCHPAKVPAAQQQALTHLFSSLTKVGVVTTQSGGQWYVAPVRTVEDIGSLTLSGLQGNDLLELFDLGH